MYLQVVVLTIFYILFNFYTSLLKRIVVIIYSGNRYTFIVLGDGGSNSVVGIVRVNINPLQINIKTLP